MIVKTKDKNGKNRWIRVKVSRDRNYFVLSVNHVINGVMFEAACANVVIERDARLVIISTKKLVLKDGSEIDFRGRGYAGAILKCAGYIAGKNGRQFLEGNFNGDENAVKMYKNYGFKFYKSDLIYDQDDNKRLENYRPLEENEDPVQIVADPENTNTALFVKVYVPFLNLSTNHGSVVQEKEDDIVCGNLFKDK